MDVLAVFLRADLRLMLRCRPRVGFGVFGRGMGSLSAPRRCPRLSWITCRMLRTHSCFSSNDDACGERGRRVDGLARTFSLPDDGSHRSAARLPSAPSCCRMSAFVQPTEQTCRDPPRCAPSHRALRSERVTRRKNP